MYTSEKIRTSDGLRLITQLAHSLHTLTGCQIVFAPLETDDGYYMYGPDADDTFIDISSNSLTEGDHFNVARAMLALASYHVALPAGDWRRLGRIEVAYRNGLLVGPYLDELNLSEAFNSVIAGLCQQNQTLAWQPDLSYIMKMQEVVLTERTEARLWTIRTGSLYGTITADDIYPVII